MSNFLLRMMAIPMVAFGLLSCDESKSTSSGPGPDADPKVVSEPGMFAYSMARYQHNGGVLALDFGKDHVDTVRYCITGRTGFSEPDSLVIDHLFLNRLDTGLVRIVGNDLTLYMEADTSGYRSVFAVHYRRIGDGTGLVGEWRADEYRVRDAGVWTTRGKVDLAEVFDTRLELTATTYRWVHRQRLSWAAAEILKWNRSTWSDEYDPDSTSYDIELTQIDSEAVQYRGRKTGEIVVRRRIRAGTRNPYSGDVQVSSSDPSHKTFVIKERAEFCPDRLLWHLQFMSGNRKLPIDPV